MSKKKKKPIHPPPLLGMPAGFTISKDDVTVFNCIREEDCPLSFYDMDKVDKADSYRVCEHCSKNVFKAVNEEEVEMHTKLGHCVAFIPWEGNGQ